MGFTFEKATTLWDWNGNFDFDNWESFGKFAEELGGAGIGGKIEII